MSFKILILHPLYSSDAAMITSEIKKSIHAAGSVDGSPFPLRELTSALPRADASIQPVHELIGAAFAGSRILYPVLRRSVRPV